MRYFDKNRRKLIKPYYVRGLKKTMAGASELTLENAIDAHIPYLEITGKTVQNGTPTPEAPIPIQNANDNGMGVVLRGENLFNAQGEITKVSGSSARYSYANNSITKTNAVSGGTDYIIYGKEYPAGTYILSAKSSFSINERYNINLLCTKSNGGTYNSFYQCYYKTIVGNTEPSVSFTFTVNEPFQIGFAFAPLSNGGTMSITDIMLTPTSQAVKYKPYVEETIEIPTSIDVNGTNVPLLFSVYDKLAVDGKAGKVKYLQGGYYNEITGNEGMGYSSSRGYAWVIVPHRLTGNGYSSHHQGTSVMFLNGLSFGDSGIAFSEPAFSSTDDLGTYLKEQNANGTPVTVLAELENPMEYDITKTELGQALLSLATRQGTNYLEIVGDLEPSALNVTYYSESEQDQVNLTIKYMCGDREIKEPRVQEIRKGSKYLIVSPHIDGYTRISSEVYGVADENVEIELIYEENSDATI